MSKDPRVAENTTWSNLLSGIFIDVTKLVAQELELAKLELQADIRRTKAYFALMILGGFIAGMGLLILLVMAAHLLNSGTKLPLWVCFGIVGGTTLLVGGVLLIVAKIKNSKIDFIPQRSAEAVKEDLEWIRSSIKTSRIEQKPGPH